MDNEMLYGLFMLFTIVVGGVVLYLAAKPGFDAISGMEEDRKKWEEEQNK